jgi:hypothetical protein
MPHATWMSVVLYQRQGARGMGGAAPLPYALADADPLPPGPDHSPSAGVISRLVARLRGLTRTRGSVEGALP